MLETPELQERWKSLDVKPVGMVVQGGASPWQHREDLEILRQANPPADELLFLSFPGPSSWRLHFSDDGLQCCRAEPNSRVGRRAGRSSFTASRLEQLGVTFEDEARALALRAIQATTESEMQRVVRCRQAQIISVPPDGLCCYHALIAARDSARFLRSAADITVHCTVLYSRYSTVLDRMVITVQYSTVL